MRLLLRYILCVLFPIIPNELDEFIDNEIMSILNHKQNTDVIELHVKDENKIEYDIDEIDRPQPPHICIHSFGNNTSEKTKTIHQKSQKRTACRRTRNTSCFENHVGFGHSPSPSHLNETCFE